MKDSVTVHGDCPVDLEEFNHDLESRRGESRPIVAQLIGLWTAGTEGGSLVEFALVLPMMLILITGMFSIGIALNNYMVLTNAVGVGARALALSQGAASGATDPCAYAVGVANNAALGMHSGIAYTITWSTTDPTSGKVSSKTYPDGTSSSDSPSCTEKAGTGSIQGDTVVLKAVYSYTPVVYGWAPGALNMTAQTTELVQ